MNFLHIEDDDADAELVEATLSREWPGCKINRLASRAELESALREQNFDLIISDHSMPGFDGITALSIARSASPNTPFVFLSGTIGEERAIQALKDGAADYVLKESPARLASALRSAMEKSQKEAARLHAESSLRQSEEQFQRIAENTDDFIVLLDGNGHCLYANPAFRGIVGEGEVSLARNILENVHREDHDRFRQLLSASSGLDAARHIEYRVADKHGGLRYLEANLTLLREGAEEEPIRLLVGRDITERKEAERRLLEQASLLERARDAICVIDLKFAITYLNPSAERMFGRQANSLFGASFREIFFSGEGSRFDTIFALTLAEGEWHGEFQLTHFGGKIVTVESSWTLLNDESGTAKSILCIITDVTKRKQLEVELQRARRVESIGMLASGIAHDLNNVLAPILMSVDLLRPLAKTSQDEMILDTLEATASHGSDLVQQILHFARGGDGRQVEVQTGAFLCEAKGFLKAAFRGKVDLEIESDANVQPICADATQLKQVLMNLCVNARDAMPRGGKVRITAANVDFVPRARRNYHGAIDAGPYVRLSVADNGTGIPPEVVEKIFEPFFTTKGIGKGTGLGLSTILSIVEEHHGAIDVESTVGVGTTFHIYLPAATGSPVLYHRNENLGPKGQGELILLIDDDAGVRWVTEKVLTTAGYRTVSAPDGEQGMAELRRQESEIKLVLCDSMLPDSSGEEILRQIASAYPFIKAVMMSGAEPPDELVAAATYLKKPVESARLLGVIRETLDGIGVASAATLSV